MVVTDKMVLDALLAFEECQRIEALRDALEPFVKWLDALDGEFSDHSDNTIAGGLKGGKYVTFGDLRRARAALSLSEKIDD